MKIGVIGTGMVGRALAARLAGLGHDVVIGTRDPAETLARTEPDDLRTPPYAEWQTEWQRANRAMRLLTLAEAGAHGDVIVNATLGAVSVEALEGVGAANLARKVILDLALPLDRAAVPPRLLYALSDSLGERIQRAFPEARVVKSLCTVQANVMVDPARVPGRHTMFVAGDDARAKAAVRHLLGEFGWPEAEVLDLGGIAAARAMEMYAPLLFATAGVLGTFDFNIAVVRAS